jgi:hypothetical protein
MKLKLLSLEASMVCSLEGKEYLNKNNKELTKVENFELIL